MVQHLKLHSGEKNYACIVCQKQFSQKIHLIRHAQIHTGICVKTFTCEICTKTFTEKRNLMTHMRTHTGEKPFSCSLCELSFSQKMSLDRHMTRHTGDRPYACSFCPKQFCEKNKLEEHLRKHTGEKPFMCPICDKQFYLKRSLTLHAKVHSKTPTFAECEITQTTSESFHSVLFKNLYSEQNNELLIDNSTTPQISNSEDIPAPMTLQTSTAPLVLNNHNNTVLIQSHTAPLGLQSRDNTHTTSIQSCNTAPIAFKNQNNRLQSEDNTHTSLMQNCNTEPLVFANQNNPLENNAPVSVIQCNPAPLVVKSETESNNTYNETIDHS